MPAGMIHQCLQRDSRGNYSAAKYQAAGKVTAIQATRTNPSRTVMDFRVELDVFRGPLDLLLYLVRKHEVEITDIPIALVTEQYLAYLTVLEQVDVNAVGDFLEMASTLVEIKSRMVLPRGGEVEEDLDDPRKELVRQLLEYKKFKDAASMLEERNQLWQQHFPRLADDLPQGQRNLAEQGIREIEVWDLVSAFGRVMSQRKAAQGSNIVYDDTPIHVHMARISATIRARGRAEFGELFKPGMHKSSLVGMFLAILELVRHSRLRAEQSRLFGEIWLMPGDESAKPIDAADVDTYEGRK